MVLMEWNDKLVLGVGPMDSEHQGLVEAMNRVYELDQANAGKAAVDAALQKLAALTTKHFADEEAILFARRYPQLETHKRAHAGLLRRAEFLNAQAAAGEATLGAVVEFLAEDVVARHLMTVDRAFFPLFEHAGPA